MAPQRNRSSAALRSVLVTGGGSGIGASLSAQLADRGCSVIVTGRRREQLAEVAEKSGAITAMAGDVTEARHRRDLASALGELPGPRGLVHAAGMFQTGKLTELSPDDWRRSFDINVESRWALSTECAALLDGGGRVLFIGSDAGANPRVGAGAYSIAQAASESLRRVLQAEWADTTRAVGAFKPGLVDTDMVRGFMARPVSEFPARDDYLAYIDSGQLASAAAVAEFACWLLLDVRAETFTNTEWDIRDEWHHAEWATSQLYPGRTG